MQMFLNVPLTQTVDNFRRLRELLPDAPNPEDLSAFGNFFANKLERKGTANALTVFNVLSGSLRDIEQNWDNNLKQHVDIPIAGKPAKFYVWYFENMERIIDAVFTPDVASAIKEIWQNAYRLRLSA